MHRSGLGVLKRNPDSKWKLQPEFIVEIKKTQQEVLQNYSKMVKPGGKMVYATCSILPSENRQQVDLFLTSEAGKNFTFVKENKIDEIYCALADLSNTEINNYIDYTILERELMVNISYIYSCMLYLYQFYYL